MSNKKLTKNKAVYLSIILLSLMLVFSYIEAIFPINVAGIGIKIGLSNILTILGLKMLGYRRTLLINVLRLLIIGMLFGNLVRFAISVVGFILSFIVMSYLLNILNFSIVTTSIFGGIFHNIGQVLAVSLITKNLMILRLMPIYIIVGFITGFIIGIITNILYSKIKLIVFD